MPGGHCLGTLHSVGRAASGAGRPHLDAGVAALQAR